MNGTVTTPEGTRIEGDTWIRDIGDLHIEEHVIREVTVHVSDDQVYLTEPEYQILRRLVVARERHDDQLHATLPELVRLTGLDFGAVVDVITKLREKVCGHVQIVAIPPDADDLSGFALTT